MDQPEEKKARFEDLGLSPVMHEALAKATYEYPTPVQAGLIPRALAGVDVVGQARTGTGKTASFAIPILEKLVLNRDIHHVQALVMVPTRELAVQVHDEIVKLSHGRRVHCVAVYGGKPIRGQIEKLQKGAQVVVGTPGRVLDHLARGTINLSSLKIAVLDEADRMLDIGFRPDIEKILRRCPRERQTLLLSATVPPPIARIAQKYMRDPETLNFTPNEMTVAIDQYYFTVDQERKFELLVRLLAREKPRQAIIFCRTKRGTDRVFQRLSKRTQFAGAIHGDMQQTHRDRVMAAFRANKVRFLVATDVVGRGIDVTNISHIINFDVPAFCDDYVHRVGRTGRMGREGVAYTFVCPHEGPELTRIEERIRRLLKRDEIKDFEASAWKLGTPVGYSRAKGMAAAPEVDGEGLPVAAPPPPPTAFMKRPPKKYRKAL
jgi:ATP-dependent RNA helicase DeaD